MLYFVSTPIGNLKDITYRAVEVLSDVDYILCEDTRKSRILLDFYKIKKKLVSFHKFNEKKEEEKIIQDLKNGLNIAVISDAGTPVLCDPGSWLTQACIKEEIPFTALPGACSITNAIVLAGFNSLPFQFTGFLPKKPSELKKAIQRMIFYPGLSVCFESPARIVSTLNIIKDLNKNQNIAIARELTKKFEEIIRGTPEEVLNKKADNFKGEIVLLISPSEIDFKDMDTEEMIKILKQFYGLSSKEALKIGAKLKNEPKKNLYKELL